MYASPSTKNPHPLYAYLPPPRAAERAAEQAALGSSGAAARAGFSTSLYGGQAVTASMERSAKGFFDVLASGFTWVARAAEELGSKWRVVCEGGGEEGGVIGLHDA